MKKLLQLSLTVNDWIEAVVLWYWLLNIFEHRLHVCTKETVTVSLGEVVQFLIDRPLIVFHHILVPVIGFPALMYFRDGYGDCLLGTSFMIEASTPFVSARVILVHLNMKVCTQSNRKMMIASDILSPLQSFTEKIQESPCVSRLKSLNSQKVMEEMDTHMNPSE